VEGRGGSGKAAEAEAYADGRVDHMVKACSAIGKKTHKDSMPTSRRQSSLSLRRRALS
jgi:hypothetical protein